MNNKRFRRAGTLFLALALVLSLFSGLALTASAEEVWKVQPTGYTKASDVVYVKDGSRLANWGVREETATFLTTYAQNYYTGSYTFDSLKGKQGNSNVNSTPSSQLYKALSDMMNAKSTSTTSYQGTRDLYKYTDCMVSDYKYISSFYSGIKLNGAWDSGATWNREHTWPNSKISNNGENDIMMLRPTWVKENSDRGNMAYGESSGYYDPNDVAKGQFNLHGDCARIILYVYVRWGVTDTMWGQSGVMESLNVLLKWMEEDPVDTWELGRNDAVQAITGVRNAFVDYPEYAWLLFGQQVPANYPSPSGSALGPVTPTATVSFDPGTGKGSMAAVTVNVGENYVLPACAFTHDNAQRTFYKWSVDGALKDPGETVKVNGDLTVKALWKYTDGVTIDNSVDNSITVVTGHLKLTDTRTGEAQELDVYDETAASTFTNPSNDAVNALIEGAKEALSGKAQELAGDKPVTVLSNDVSNLQNVDHTDGRTFTYLDNGFDDAGDYYNHTLVITGEVQFQWRYTVTLEAEYASDPPAGGLQPIQAVKVGVIPPIAGTTSDARSAEWAVSLPNDRHYQLRDARWEEKLEDGSFQECYNTTFEAGKTYYVWIELAADEGYMFCQGGPYGYTTAEVLGEGVALVDESLTVVNSTGEDGTAYSFVTFRVAFTPTDPCEGYTDVDRTAWYHGAVDYALANGLMNGTSGTTFEPDTTMTRAMLVQVLYNLEGKPEADTQNAPAFTDVKGGAWYAKAVLWAAANGVVSGYDTGAFGVDDPVTREQIASILYRYADYKGADLTGAADLSTFPDENTASSWAAPAVAWAVNAGFISGKGQTDGTVLLAPQGQGSRAEVASMLMRFCQNVSIPEERLEHTHAYTVETITAPTCTQVGAARCSCDCGYSFQATLPALGHEWGAWTTTKEATCTAAGSREHSCSRCGRKETEDIAALGHSYSNGACTRCGEKDPNYVQILDVDEAMRAGNDYARSIGMKDVDLSLGWNDGYFPSWRARTTSQEELNQKARDAMAWTIECLKATDPDPDGWQLIGVRCFVQYMANNSYEIVIFYG